MVHPHHRSLQVVNTLRAIPLPYWGMVRFDPFHLPCESAMLPYTTVCDASPITGTLLGEYTLQGLVEWLSAPPTRRPDLWAAAEADEGFQTHLLHLVTHQACSPAVLVRCFPLLASSTPTILSVLIPRIQHYVQTSTDTVLAELLGQRRQWMYGTACDAGHSDLIEVLRELCR